jgi:hypothetical protein
LTTVCGWTGKAFWQGPAGKPDNILSNYILKGKHMPAQQKKWGAPPPMKIDPQKTYHATFHTDKGDFTVRLHADKAPKTVNNFVFLAEEGFYNDTIFHRVIANFMAQAATQPGPVRGAQAIVSRMSSTPLSAMTNPAYSPWRMLGQIPMGASSSSHMSPHLG